MHTELNYLFFQTKQFNVSDLLQTLFDHLKIESYNFIFLFGVQHFLTFVAVSFLSLTTLKQIFVLCRQWKKELKRYSSGDTANLMRAILSTFLLQWLLPAIFFLLAVSSSFNRCLIANCLIFCA